jgi:chromosome segregation ATPase
MNTPSFTQQIISLIDKIEDRDSVNCALAYRAISERLIGLYNAKISTETGLTEKLKDLIEEKRKKIKTHNGIITELLDFMETNKAISDEAIQLEKQIEVLEEKKKRIESLRQKKEELGKVANDFAILDKTIANINLQNDKLVKQIKEKLETVNSLLTKYSTSIDAQSLKVVQVTKENLNTVNRQSKELLDCLNPKAFESSAEKLDNDLESRIANYNKYVNKINGIIRELEGLESKCEEVEELYRQRFDKDKEIFGTLEGPSAINSYLEETLGDADSFLIEFESKIKSLVEERKSLSLMEIYQKQQMSTY